MNQDLAVFTENVLAFSPLSIRSANGRRTGIPIPPKRD